MRDPYIYEPLDPMGEAEAKPELLTRPVRLTKAMRKALRLAQKMRTRANQRRDRRHVTR
jgi:hypothetical protein